MRAWRGWLIGLGLWAPLLWADELRIQECLIEPSASVELGASGEGLLEAVLVDRGDRVTQGQVVARLTADLEAVTLRIAETRAANRAAIESGRSRVAYFGAQRRRSAQLRERQLVAAEGLERSRTEEALANAELRLAELEYELAQLERERADILLAQRQVTSPFDGVVLVRHMHPGEYVNEQSVLMTLVAMDRLHVEAFLPLTHFPGIRPGMTLMVETRPPFAGRHEAEVETVDRVFDAASGTFGVRLVLDNQDRQLPAGIRCVLLIPEQV
ncbi:efflux RND transporter periplasmic adaptor subunit [Halomonas sp. H5]|uniref:efflux RND transporter periplasmic adaptor subunit n=1 Tax=Halomonas sp. H5 TaxID=3423910 RepID=UPI003D36FB6D